MNDDELKSLFKSMDHGRPDDAQVSVWKRVVRRELERTPSDWLRLVAACAIGVVIGASAMKLADSGDRENFDDDATIERVHVNLD